MGKVMLSTVLKEDINLSCYFINLSMFVIFEPS